MAALRSLNCPGRSPGFSHELIRLPFSSTFVMREIMRRATGDLKKRTKNFEAYRLRVLW